jgi:protein-tyrosine phosphatase
MIVRSTSKKIRITVRGTVAAVCGDTSVPTRAPDGIFPQPFEAATPAVSARFPRVTSFPERRRSAVTFEVRPPGRPFAIASLPNLRDLGGYAGDDGREVRTGLLYRSGALNNLQGEDAVAFGALALKTVFDLRTEAEQRAMPDVVFDGVRAITLDISQDFTTTAAVQLAAALADPRSAREVFGDGQAIDRFERGYRELVALPSARAAYRELFVDLARDECRPALFHCTTGKDRTGWAAAAFLLLLGVSEADVFGDYLLTNERLVPAFQQVFDVFADVGGDPDLLRPVIGVRPEYLHAALDEMRTTFGSIDEYFADGLGIDAKAQSGLRAIYLEGS